MGTPYSIYVRNNFSFNDHHCNSTCSCVALGCTHHWQWNKGEPPDMEDMRYQLATWQAFRNKDDAQYRFLLNYHKIARLVEPLANTTIVCKWQEQAIADIYDQAKGILGGSVVLTTKTLHFFLPDLFIILDRVQVFSKWKGEMRRIGFNTLIGPIEAVSGRRYTGLLDYVRQMLHFRITRDEAVTLAGNSSKPLATVRQLRFVSPLVGNKGEWLPNTFGKALDNMVRSARYEL